jgi:succinate dehydrogenase hydrophobic anchor subunit
MFFGIGALFSVFVLIYIDLINFREVMRCLLLAPGVIVGIVLGRQKIVKDYVNINLKKLILIICFVSAILVLTQAFI